MIVIVTFCDGRSSEDEARDGLFGFRCPGSHGQRSGEMRSVVER
jgi:hypothetical protein